MKGVHYRDAETQRKQIGTRSPRGLCALAAKGRLAGGVFVCCHHHFFQPSVCEFVILRPRSPHRLRPCLDGSTMARGVTLAVGRLDRNCAAVLDRSRPYVFSPAIQSDVNCAHHPGIFAELDCTTESRQVCHERRVRRTVALGMLQHLAVHGRAMHAEIQPVAELTRQHFVEELSALIPSSHGSAAIRTTVEDRSATHTSHCETGEGAIPLVTNAKTIVWELPARVRLFHPLLRGLC